MANTVGHDATFREHVLQQTALTAIANDMNFALRVHMSGLFYS